MKANGFTWSRYDIILLQMLQTSTNPYYSVIQDNFEDNPGRKWLNHFLFETSENTENENSEDELADISQKSTSGGKFVDSFRHFHPKRSNAFTCWSTLTGARQTNYGTRIDYIFSDRPLVETAFIGVDIMPEVEGSDHCPVWAQLSCTLQSSPKCPPLCTRHMPEFTGRQQKLSRFLVKVPEKPSVSKGCEESLPGSQDVGEIRENLNPVVQGNSVAKKRPTDREADTNAHKAKRSKQTKTDINAKGSLLAFFKPKQTALMISSGNLGPKQEESSQDGPGSESDTSSCPSDVQMETNFSKVTEMEIENQDEVEGESTSIDKSKDCKKGPCAGFWKTFLRGPPQPPLCKSHNEPCVLRTVKKAGPNLGRQFFVCARPQGHASNPQARCNFFAWVEKGKQIKVKESLCILYFMF